MAAFVKDVVKAGRYRLPTGRWLDLSPSDVRHLARRMDEMVADGLKIPVAWNHQPVAPLTDEDWLAARARHVIGHSHGAVVEGGGTLAARVDADDAEAERMRRAKYVSPEIRRDWIDGRGKLWPGLSITHVAVTGNPVNPDQQPFRSVQLSADVFRLSLDDLETEGDDVAEENDGKKDDGGGDASGLKPLIDALREKGMNIPDEVMDMDGLVIAVKASGAAPPAEATPADTGGDGIEEDSGPVLMSLDEAGDPRMARLARMERDDLKRRAKALAASGRLTRQEADALAGEFDAVRLSMDGEGRVRAGRPLAKLEAYEALAPRKGGFLDASRLSLDGLKADAPPGRDAAKEEAEARELARRHRKGDFSANGTGGR